MPSVDWVLAGVNCSSISVARREYGKKWKEVGIEVQGRMKKRIRDGVERGDKQ